MTKEAKIALVTCALIYVVFVAYTCGKMIAAEAVYRSNGARVIEGTHKVLTNDAAPVSP